LVSRSRGTEIRWHRNSRKGIEVDRGLIGRRLARVAAVSTALLVPLALSACGGGSATATATAEVDPSAAPDAGKLAAVLVAQRKVDPEVASCTAQALLKRLGLGTVRTILAGQSSGTGAKSPTGVSMLDSKIGVASLACSSG
jgi:hypothetical protein